MTIAVSKNSELSVIVNKDIYSYREQGQVQEKIL